MNIVTPNNREKRQSIDLILNEGLHTKKSFKRELLHIFRVIGLQNSFFGITDAFVLTIIFSAVGVGLLAVLSLSLEGGASNANIYVLTACVSPITYFAFSLFTHLKERMIGTYEIIETCRYNLSHLAVIRLIVISIMNLIVVSIGALIIRGVDDFVSFSYLHILGVSICTALIYGIVTLLILIFPVPKVTGLLMPVIWVAAGFGLLAILHTYRFPLHIMPIPTPIILLTLLVLTAVYYLEFRIFVKKVLKGTIYYAFS